MIELQSKKRNAKASHGFTIVELLIATLVFSVVLLIVTSGIMQVARVYIKGVTETSTQSTARAVMDTVSQAIQFGGGVVTQTATSPSAGTDYAFCIGSQQFSYRLGSQVENGTNATKHQAWHGLVQRSAADCTAQNLDNQAVTGRDLVGPHMRLANLAVQSIGNNQYKVQVRVVYGDDDLLNNPTAANANCKDIQVGTQFCSQAELSSIVVKRVQ
jgi:prepilin-type N-terminal cleavage/methylation domain-containing protein